MVSNNDRGFKNEMADFYTKISEPYDQDGYYSRIAEQLVSGVDIFLGDRILDVPTGKGAAGLAALKRAGDSGRLVGVDISEGMISGARQNAKGASNAEFVIADAEHMDLEESFDVLLSSSGMLLFEDRESLLHHWMKFLVPGGRIAIQFSCKESFAIVEITDRVLSEFGFEVNAVDRMKITLDECQKLFEVCGLKSVRYEEKRTERSVPLEVAQSFWDLHVQHPFINLSALVPDEEKRQEMRVRYGQLVSEAAKDGVIQFEDVILYFYATKPMSSV